MKYILQSPNDISDAWLLYDDGQGWFIKIGKTINVINSNEFSVKMTLLPFLEIPFDNLPDTIRNPDFDFPFYCLFEAAFFHGSGNWVRDALLWFEKLEKSETERFKKELSEVVENKKQYSQADRHLARKLLKR